MKAKLKLSENNHILQVCLLTSALILSIFLVSSLADDLESSDASAWLLIAPSNGEIIPPSPVYFDWNVIPGTYYYQLQVATSSIFLDRTIVLYRPKVYNSEYTTYDLQPGYTYYWRIRSKDYNNQINSEWCTHWSFTTTIPTDIPGENETNLPEKFSMEQNYPNPFNPTTTIKFYLPRTEHVALTIYDLLGREVTILLDSEFSYGSQTITWDGTDKRGKPVAGGVYLYRLHAGNYSETKKMLFLK